MARKVHSIKFSDDEWAQAERRAERQELATSTFVREAATGEIEPTSKRTRQAMVAEFHQLGGQINDWRKEMKEAGYEHDSIAAGKLLDRALEAIERAEELIGATPADFGEEPNDEGQAPELSEQEPTR